MDSVPAATLRLRFFSRQRHEPVSIDEISHTLKVAPGDTAYTESLLVRYNEPPRFIGTIQQLQDTVVFGETYCCSLDVENPDNDRLGYAFSEHYSHMIRTPSHDRVFLCWMPGIADTGLCSVSLRVWDQWGGADTVHWHIWVEMGDSLPPPPSPVYLPGFVEQGAVCTVMVHQGWWYPVNDAQYRVSWGDGDTSAWQGDSIATHIYHTAGEFDVRFQVRLPDSIASEWSEQHVITVEPAMIPKPGRPQGPAQVVLGDTTIERMYRVPAKQCFDTGAVAYQFAWGDGTTGEWNTQPQDTATWTKEGRYLVRARYRCVVDTAIVSAWSLPLEVSVMR
jgi:hypothetical protein